MGYRRTHPLRSNPLVRYGLAASLIVAFVPFPVQCQQASEAASLSGTVRDAQGRGVADAVVQLQSNGSPQNLTVHTDAQGEYSFAALHEGVYALRVSKSGYADLEVPSLALGVKEAKTVDLTLGPEKSASKAASSAPQFFDQPQFTVAGVTDTTSLGGHGSNAMVHSREALVKEAVALGKAPPAASANSTMREKSLREEAERDPSSFDANYRLGQLLLEDGKAREAIQYLERAATASPNDYENAYELALANANASNYERARDSARSLLATHDKAELHHLLAGVDEKLGDPLEAVRQYERAAELDPSEPYLFDWASELLLHHAPEPALEVFAKGNHLFPHSARTLIGVGAAQFALGSYDEAVQQICEASDLNPNDPTPYLFLGKMLRAESSPSVDLVEKLRRFVTLQPQNSAANYFYAVALWKSRKDSQDKERASQAESLLNNALRLDPKFAAADLQLGVVHSEQGNRSAAILDYQRALQIDPQLEEAHYRLAQVYRSIGQAEKAKQEFQLYEQCREEAAKKDDRESHELRQFVYTLRDQPPPQP